jgi:hypothetical protein
MRLLETAAKPRLPKRAAVPAASTPDGEGGVEWARGALPACAGTFPRARVGSPALSEGAGRRSQGSAREFGLYIKTVRLWRRRFAAHRALDALMDDRRSFFADRPQGRRQARVRCPTEHLPPRVAGDPRRGALARNRPAACKSEIGRILPGPTFRPQRVPLGVHSLTVSS